MTEQFYDLFLGDCLKVLSDLEDNSIDTVITDPPYGLSEEPDMSEVLGHWLVGDDYEHRGGGFMGKSWDSFVPGPSVWKEVLRVMKPGACLMAFGGTRTVDLLSISIRLAGFRKFDEIDYYYGGLPPQIAWVYGQGFPKSHAIGKALDKAAGAEREVIGTRTVSRDYTRNGLKGDMAISSGPVHAIDIPITAPATDAATLWDGWGTALKPAHEVILCFYKPRDGTFANNALKWGVAGIWVDGGRVGTDDTRGKASKTALGLMDDDNWQPKEVMAGCDHGRWPANLILDEEAAAMLDKMSGQSGSSVSMRGERSGNIYGGGKGPSGPDTLRGHNDTGGASRFFYTAKSSPSERNEGCEDLYWRKEGKNFIQIDQAEWTMLLPKQRAEGNVHPTVKPLNLLRYLVRLTRTPTGGIVLDLFMGSGSTGVACIEEDRSFIGIEIEEASLIIAEARMEHAWKETEE